MGKWVYLRLQPYWQATMQQRRSLKLSPHFYGPFQVVQRIVEVAYRLKLPETAQIHDVLHVSQLKKKLGQDTIPIPKLPPVNQQGVIRPEPKEVLARRLRKKKNKPVTEILVRWQGQDVEDASWEPYHTVRAEFPHLVDKVL